MAASNPKHYRPVSTETEAVLTAIRQLREDLTRRMDRLEMEVHTLRGEVEQQGMLLRGIAKSILPDEAME